MRATILGLCIVAAVAGCAADSAEPTSRGERADGTAGDGSSSGGDFGNASATQPPPPARDLMITGGGCKAGHYVGFFEGMYQSPAAFELPVPIMSVDLVDPLGMMPPLPGFEFWLEATEDMPVCDGDQEFCFDFKVEGGIVRGQANGIFPFEVELVGDLDCSQGIFKGILENGWYEVFTVRYAFEGWMDSSYASVDSQFFDGMWAVTEPDSVAMGGTAGGDGIWYAGWVMDMP